MADEIKSFEEDKEAIIREYLEKQAKRMNEEKRRSNSETVKHILDSDLKTLLTEAWDSPQVISLILEIKKVQYMEKKKESDK
jgi:hypothetical protein